MESYKNEEETPLSKWLKDSYKIMAEGSGALWVEVRVQYLLI